MKIISIIGAWAAWLMTAVTILENSKNTDFHIHIFEKNAHPGKKVIISGGWRCNLTTGITDKKELLSRYTRGSEFIKTALGKFSPKKCREWFEAHGVPLKCELDNRVFPVSDNGKDVVWVFEKIFEKYPEHISLHFSEWVENIESSEKWYNIHTKNGDFDSDIVVITTGGNAYSHTGSTGDGYAFARSLGHTVTPLGPSLSSFLIWEEWIKTCSGVALEKAKITFEVDGKNKSLDGSLLFTHFGISWPLTFRVSSHLAFEMITEKHTKTIKISPLADMGFEEWEKFLKSEFASHPKKTIINILNSLLSRRFAENILFEYFPNLEGIFVGSIWRSEREKLSHLLGDGFPITLKERRPGDEFVTAGWVSTIEIDDETMESRIKKDLYFAGEILDVDGVTGGFSLQICWSSGYVAGINIANNMNI